MIYRLDQPCASANAQDRHEVYTIGSGELLITVDSLYNNQD